MPRNKDNDFTKNIRDALLCDPQLVRMLGGAHIFEDATGQSTVPHITIGQTRVLDWSAQRTLDGQRTVTLQVWPKTREKAQAQKVIDCAHHALEVAGLIGGERAIRLNPEFSGSRRTPESKEIHGILRYRALRRGNAA